MKYTTNNQINNQQPTHNSHQLLGLKANRNVFQDLSIPYAVVELMSGQMQWYPISR